MNLFRLQKNCFKVIASRQVLLCLCVSLWGSMSFAREQLDAHVHGIASLSIATENNQMEIQFESPAVNLLGFEHKPESQQELDALSNTKTALMTAAELFTFTGATCQSTNISIDIIGPAGNADHASDHHDHDDEHADEDDHDHEHAHDDKHDGSHSEVLATYQFDCKANKSAITVQVNLFEKFAGLEQVNVQWISDSSQGSGVLKANQTIVTLQ